MPTKERSVLILVPEEGLLFEAVGAADILHHANLTIPAGSPQSPYRVTMATTLPHRIIQGRSGLNLLADVCLSDLNPRQDWDTVVITGGGASEEEKEQLSAWLSLAAPHAKRVVSICTGAFILAQTGLLDGRKATTHWKASGDLSRRYPRVRVENDPIFIHDGKIWTSAGASSGFDLILALVEEDLGATVARQVARYLVLFLRRPGGQSQFGRILEEQAAVPGPIRDVQVWAVENIGQDLGVERLADRAAMSPRNFARVFARQTGTTPARFVERARVEAARLRLEQGRETLDQIANVCGLGTALNLRRSFEKLLGVSPSDYRARFGII